MGALIVDVGIMLIGLCWDDSVKKVGIITKKLFFRTLYVLLVMNSIVWIQAIALSDIDDVMVKIIGIAMTVCFAACTLVVILPNKVEGE